MQEPTPLSPQAQATAPRGADLLDLLLTVGENARLLVLGPIVVAALAWVSTLLITPHYESQLTIDPYLKVVNHSERTAAPLDPLNTSGPVLTALGSGEFLQAAAQGAGLAVTDIPQPAVSARQDNATGIIDIRVAGGTPQAAQALARAALEQLQLRTKPRGGTLEDLRAERERLVHRHAEMSATAKALDAALPTASGPLEAAAVGTARAQVANNLMAVQRQLDINAARLNGLTDTAVLREPTLASAPAGPHRMAIAIMAGMVSAALLVLWVLGRAVGSTVAPTTQQRERWAALKRRYGFKR